MSESLNAESLRAEQAATFGAAAEAYERGRPGYPEAALDRLLPDGVRTVCDLGAGTGKLTRQLVARGLDVIAVEPAPEMLEQLRRSTPGARAQPGSAEATGLADQQVDAVLVAQAWHWVDPLRAVAEVARILRPGGTLGLLWNLRTERSDFSTRLNNLLGGADGAARDGEVGWDHTDPASVPGSPFSPAVEDEIHWTNVLPHDRLRDMVASRSYVIAMPERERADLLVRVGEAARAGADPDGMIEIPYRTWCLRYRLTA